MALFGTLLSRFMGLKRQKVKPVEDGETEVEVGSSSKHSRSALVRSGSEAGRPRCGFQGCGSPAVKTADTLLPDSPLHSKSSGGLSAEDDIGGYDGRSLDPAPRDVGRRGSGDKSKTRSTSFKPGLLDDPSIAEDMRGTRSATSKSTCTFKTGHSAPEILNGGSTTSERFSPISPSLNGAPSTHCSLNFPSLTSERASRGKPGATLDEPRVSERNNSADTSIVALDGKSMDLFNHCGTLRTQGSSDSIGRVPSEGAEMPDRACEPHARPPARSLARSLTTRGNAFDGYWVLATRLPDSAHWLTSLTISGRSVIDATGGTHELAWGNGGTTLAGGRIIMDGDFLVRIPNEGPMQLFSRGGGCLSGF